MKLLATLGPASLSQSTVRACTRHDIYLFRINLSHTPLSEIEDTIAKIRQWTDVPICLDSEGAQLRNQQMKGDSVRFSKGAQILISHKPIEGSETSVSFTSLGCSRQLKGGDEIRIDFGGSQSEWLRLGMIIVWPKLLVKVLSVVTKLLTRIAT